MVSRNDLFIYHDFHANMVLSLNILMSLTMKAIGKQMVIYQFPSGTTPLAGTQETCWMIINRPRLYTWRITQDEQDHPATGSNQAFEPVYPPGN